ncbi:MAG: SlyX family protein [Myxococcota bacterium]
MSNAEPPREQGASGAVDGRLGELEVRSEFQARTVEDLDAVVRDFAERVSRLEQELKELRDQLEQIGGGGEALLESEGSDPLVGG